MTNSIVKAEEPLVLSRVTRSDVLDGVKHIITELKERGNLRKATAALTALETVNDTAALGRAYLMWGMQEWYDKQNKDETFFSAIGMTDTDKITYARRLITVWDQIEHKHIPADVQKKSIKSLIPIAKALSDGYTFDAGDWDEIRMAPNVGEVNRIIRKVKKTKPRSNLLDLVLALDGSIYAYVEGERHYVGYLNISDEATDEVVKQAHNRITNNSPIRRTE